MACSGEISASEHPGPDAGELTERQAKQFGYLTQVASPVLVLNFADRLIQ